jgi:hypothetical protein
VTIPIFRAIRTSLTATLMRSANSASAAFRAASPTERLASFEPQIRNLQQRLFDAYAAEVKRVSGNDEGIITAAQGDIDTATDGFPNNERLFLPPTVFNRFAVTREINDGLLAPRFAPSQRAWVLSGVRVPVSPTVNASTGRDADDR